jgi:hypothetical protein
VRVSCMLRRPSASRDTLPSPRTASTIASPLPLTLSTPSPAPPAESRPRTGRRRRAYGGSEHAGAGGAAVHAPHGPAPTLRRAVTCTVQLAAARRHGCTASMAHRVSTAPSPPTQVCRCSAHTRCAACISSKLGASGGWACLGLPRVSLSSLPHDASDASDAFLLTRRHPH